MEMSRELLMFIVGRVLTGLGLVMLLPLGVSVSESAEATRAFGGSVVIIFVLGGLLCYAGRHHRRYLTVREGAVLMVAIWFVLAAAGMLPYLFLGKLMPLEAFFESVSESFIDLKAHSRASPLPHFECVHKSNVGAGLLANAI